jgi:hypothetical protein
MPIGKQNKIELIDALERTKAKAHRLALTLRFRRREAESEQITARARKLSRRVDGLIAAAMDEWTGSAAAHKERLAGSNTRLQRIIREIEKDNNVAENVIRAVSLLDAVLQTVSEFFPSRA